MSDTFFAGRASFTSYSTSKFPDVISILHHDDGLVDAELRDRQDHLTQIL
jgi:hypothetical protein